MDLGWKSIGFLENDIWYNQLGREEWLEEYYKYHRWERVIWRGTKSNQFFQKCLITEQNMFVAAILITREARDAYETEKIERVRERGAVEKEVYVENRN